MPSARTLYPSEDTASNAPLTEVEEGRFARLRNSVRARYTEKKSKKCWLITGLVAIGVALTAAATLGLLMWTGKIEDFKCPEGYTLKLRNFGCYKAHLNVTTFDGAQEVCKSENATLMSVPCKGVNDYAIDLLNQTAINGKHELDFQYDVHIGLAFKNETWEWTDGATYKYTNWEDGYPLEEEEKGVTRIQLLKDSKEHRWINGLKSDLGYFVCHKKLLRLGFQVVIDV